MINLNGRISTPLAIIIIVILAGLLIGGIVAYWYWWIPISEIPEAEERKVVIPTSEEDCLNIKETFYQNNCYIDLAKKTKNESLCEKIEALPGGTNDDEITASKIANCYVQLAVLKNDSALCEKAYFIEGRAWYREFSMWCKSYFEEPTSYKTYELYGFSVKMPKDWKCDSVSSSQGGYFYQDGIYCNKLTDVDDIHFQILRAKPPFYFEKEKVTFEDFIVKSKQYLEKTQESVKQEGITLDGVSAVKFFSEGSSANHYLIKYKTDNYKILAQKDGNMYILEVEMDSSKSSIYKSILDQMLSTFRFID